MSCIVDTVPECDCCDQDQTPVDKTPEHSCSPAVGRAVTMLDLNRESVEYVCTKFRSPHIARRFGHKMYGDYQDPYVEALRIRALSVVRRLCHTDILSSCQCQLFDVRNQVWCR